MVQERQGLLPSCFGRDPVTLDVLGKLLRAYDGREPVTRDEFVKLLKARDEQVIDMFTAELVKSGRIRDMPAVEVGRDARDKPTSTAVLREVVRDEQGRITAVLEQAVEINDPRSG